MNNHRSLRHSILQAAGLAGGAHRARSAGIARLRATRAILALALGLGSLGAALLALPGHGGPAPAPVSAHQRVNSPAHHTAVSKIKPKPWMW